MAFATKVPLPSVSNCGGRQRLYVRGTQVVSGTTKMAGVLTPCRVFLHEAGGALRGYKESGSGGAYTFLGLAPGEYRLVIEDLRQGLKRSKVEHTVVT